MVKNNASVVAINESVISGQKIAEEKGLKINWNGMEMHWTSGFVSTYGLKTNHFKDEEPSASYTGFATPVLDRNLLRIKLRMLNKLANAIISDGFAKIIYFDINNLEIFSC
jgi:hypothetical protein